MSPFTRTEPLINLSLSSKGMVMENLIRVSTSLFYLGCGKLNFDSFVRVATHFLVEDDEALQKELKEAFRLYDKEGNGYIPTSSLREILAALDDQLTPDQLNEMIAEIDTDASGTVDFDEFMEMMTGD
ncbi:Troponin C [Operophtera brumata]|uniref:Troponin C n=1 Tax=Operophtera brumata TaxID=104452 RepID=A0A0L7LBQ5_OPEBR|nr:Troponin C [Operophtera brumata]